MFIGILGHDLRNPINAVSMTATLLRRKAVGDARALDRILSSTRRMSSMVGQLLDLTRSRLAGGIDVERRLIDVGVVVSEALDELRHAYPGREIALTLAGSLEALVDKDRLAQVISNLVGNALEHGDRSAPVNVQLFTDDAGGLCLRVHNSGPPIPPHLLPAIFDPFRRTTARDERSRGLGLGLFITQQIVLAHGGTIDVRSSAGEGTTFTVAVPRPSVEKSILAAEHLVP